MVGESLGAFGGQGAFSDIDDALAEVDHALWVGTPGFTALRKEAESSREPGSGQMFPVLGDGSDVIFASHEGDLSGKHPEVVFLQNADDPIAWWDPDLIIEKPDWIGEPLDPAVNPEISYGPVRTFLQISTDMAVGNSFEEGNGHLYGTLPITAWRQMLDSGWSDARVDELEERMSNLGR